MIPKKIHYCWFGRGKKTKLMERCIRSWHKYCPDYEIIEWNEDSFDLDMNGYTRWCYDNKKYAFLSDYARLVIVSEFGGIYFDTDVEVVRPIDDLLDKKAYFGFEDNQHINTGLGFGSEARHPVLNDLIHAYDQVIDGEHGTIGCPILNTEALLSLGLKLNGEYQSVGGADILPVDFLNPYDDPTGRLYLTENTYSIHWFAKTWMSTRKVLRSKLTKPLHRIMKKVNNRS